MVQDDRLLHKEHFYGKFRQKMCTENYQKALENLTLFFLLNPVPFNGQDYEKQKGPETSDQTFFRLQNKFRKILLLAMYYLPSSMI